ncbi:2'-5' RNA ligase family protein [Streptomyces sp. NPDC059104]|uniref:2'-5' RNA ligase family protein n=1 Tax=Streptomyces sp. NPDC059104 TaxID=3346729 RepID=UPI0036869C7E
MAVTASKNSVWQRRVPHLTCDDGGVPEPGTTAVVIVLPDAAPLLDAAWRVDPALVRPGVPAHVSLLYPFVPEPELTGRDEKGVRSLAAGFPAADLLLEEVVTASGFIAVTVAELQPVVDAFHAQWPGLRPYGGRFGARPAAHVTVAMGADDPTTAGLVRAAVGGLLPLRTRAAAVQLLALTEEGWRPRLTVPLGGSPDGILHRP